MAKTKWYQLKWRGFSGRIHVYPKKVRKIDGEWVTTDDLLPCPAVRLNIVSVKAVRA